MRLAVPFFLLMVFQVACSDDAPDFILLSFQETQCANPWGNTNDTEIIKTWLKEQDISVIEIYREQKPPLDSIICMACTCANGWICFIRVHPNDIDKALELGFTSTDTALN